MCLGYKLKTPVAYDKYNLRFPIPARRDFTEILLQALSLNNTVISSQCQQFPVASVPHRSRSKAQYITVESFAFGPKQQKRGLYQTYWHRPRDHSSPAVISVITDFTIQQPRSANSDGRRQYTSCPNRRGSSCCPVYQDR